MVLLPISLVFCRTGLIVKQYYNWDPSTSQCSLSSKGYHGHSVSQKKIRHVFLNSGDQTCPSFLKIHFKGVILNWLAPICKRKKQDPQLWLLSTGGIPPCSRWGCRQTFHQSFPSLVGPSLSLTNADVLLVHLCSITKVGWRCTRGRPDGISNWFSSIPTRPLFDLPFSSDVTWGGAQ